MKLLDITKFLIETKSVGTIYHFTSYRGMVNIFNDGLRLKNVHGQPDDRNRQYISFTRDKSMLSDSVFRQVRITVDGTKLSDKYQIRPFADFSAGYGKSEFKHNEREERALVKEKDGYVNIKDTIIRIDLIDISSYLDDEDEWIGEMEPPSLSEYKRLLEILSNSNIPYGVVRKF